MRWQTNKIVLCGVLAALAAIFSYVEALIPISVGIPGIKMGFANIVTVFAIYSLDFKSTLSINVVRILIVSAIFGNPVMAMYSLSGALLSLIGMYFLKKTGFFSIIGVSMAGGVFHNVAQVTVAALTVNTIGLLGYMAALIPVGMVTGILIGVVSKKTILHLNATNAGQPVCNKNSI